ncbi:MAG: hypothetical protein ACLRVU_12490 [Beduini sp.]|uniref:hypothetical protein n=1 Tax=Beduini sp. TaxID=1922300 RepID=UPI0039A3D65A
MSKSNRIIMAVLVVVMVMAVMYITHYAFEISRLVHHQQQEGWYEINDSKTNQ